MPSRFGCTDDEKCVVYTDSGSNMAAAEGIRKYYKWMACSDHKIATVLTTVFNKTTTTTDGVRSAPFYKYHKYAPHLFEMIDNCKKLVRYFKQANLQNCLNKTLKQKNATRWNSLLISLNNILDGYDDVTTVLARIANTNRQANKQFLITRIDKTSLAALPRFLKRFQTATLALEKYLEPTLHLVVFERSALLEYCKPRTEPYYCKDADGKKFTIPSDSDDIIVVKSLIEDVLREKWILDDLHIAAALLDPRKKDELDRFGCSSVADDAADGAVQQHICCSSEGQLGAVRGGWVTGAGGYRQVHTIVGAWGCGSDFSKPVMQRGGRDTRPRQGLQRIAGGGEQHGLPRREPTPEFDDDNIELFLDVYLDHATQRGWSVAERIYHLRGVGRFEEPVAQICEEALTWPDVEAGMQRLRASPRGRDGMPIRLEEGNADEFIPAVERRWRSKRPREPAPREARLARERRGAPAQREDEPVGPALAEESLPACGLRAVEFRRITSEELRPPSPLQSAQELDIPRETPFRSLATHLDASRWEASRLGEGLVEPTYYVPLEEPLDTETETDMRGQEEPQDPEMAAERPDPVRPQEGEVITVGDDTPPCSPAPEPAQRSWPEGIPEPGSEEISESPPEASTMREQEAEAENQGVCERARMEAPLDLPSATHVTKSPVIEDPVPAELPLVVPCASEGMEGEASTPGGQGPQVRRTPRETREEKSARVRIRLDEIHARQAEMEAAGIESTPPVEPKSSEHDELWTRYESQRDAARQRPREAGPTGEGTSELREMGDVGFSATRMAIERMDRRICEMAVTSFQWYNLLSNELRVKELEVEHLTTRLAEEKARSQAREVEWERRFGEMAAVVGRLSAAWEASQAGRAGADGQGRGMRASPSQGAAVEVPQQAEPVEEVPLDTAREEGGAQESLMAMSTERRGSSLHELAAAMGIGTPQEGPQRLDAPEHAPRLGELRAELGSWATGTSLGGLDLRQQQRQEVMSELTAMGGSQPSGACGDEVVVTEGPHEEGSGRRS
ncbi:hypothetical protein CBR_g22409 [Chara braunii]|uniref:Uncharacterized protein n=1 Tax=Chara braunii TaxID=69332 RepID=A0A388JV70_CHABU|nr:hypothetical protein CBR_g22409 [Chara braunii]|eukprot:GBG61612.1 hypothetical protein CBR_g22409 [Chara braunii]